MVASAAVLLAACGSSSSSAGGTKGTTAGGGTTATTTGTTGGSSSGTTPATGSLAGLYGSVPEAGTATTGGTITYGQVSGQVPTYIFPITPSAQGSVTNSYSFQDDLYLPLYASPEGSVPTYDTTLSVAKPAVYSDGDKTVTINLNTQYKWSSGAPVVAQDVVFFIDLVKAAIKESAANFSNYSPGFFPDNVASATATSKYTLTLKLTKAYNPGYFNGDQLDLLFAFPSQSWDKASLTGPAVSYTTPAGAKKIYDFLAKQAASLSTFATSPIWGVVDGPAKLSSFTSSTGAYSFVPNTSYGGSPKMTVSKFSVDTFTTYQAEFNALRAGTLDIGQIDQTDLPQVSSIKSGYNVYGLPDFGFEAAFFNFKDTTGHFDKIIGQLYVRQALAHLEDQAGYVKGIFKGAGAVAYGPIPSAPTSPYAPANALTAEYPFSISAASQLLSSHGWKVVPNGQTTCETAGTAANECGAGIPVGTPLSFNLFYSPEPTIIGLQDTALASDAAQVGIKISLTSKTFNYLIQNFDNPSAKSNINKWAVNDFGGFTNSVYPSTNDIFNTTGEYNLGSYSDPMADKLINGSVFGGNPTAVKSEASYLTSQVPALFQPTPDLLFGASKKVGGNSKGFLALTQYTLYPQFFYLSK